MKVITTAFITACFGINIIFFILKIKKLQLFEKCFLFAPLFTLQNHSLNQVLILSTLKYMGLS